MKIRFQVLFVAGLFILGAQEARAFSCFVLSGKHADEKHGILAFKNKRLVNPHLAQIAGRPCTVLAGWKSLLYKLQQEPLPQNEQLLIVQVAHGNKVLDGGVILDEGLTFAWEIDAAIQFLSERYYLGVVLYSCGSGKLMLMKLQREYEQLKEGREPRTLERVCLLTASLPGRAALASNMDVLESFERAKKGETLEDVYLRTLDGLISSAAWEDVSFSKFLSERDWDLGIRVLEALPAYAKNSPFELHYLAARASANPSTTIKRMRLEALVAEAKQIQEEAQEEGIEGDSPVLQSLKERKVSMGRRDRAFFRGPFAEGERPADERSVFLTSMIGEGFLVGEQRILDTHFEDTTPVTQVDRISPSAALVGFSMGSVQTQHFAHPIDLQRRSACRALRLNEPLISLDF